MDTSPKWTLFSATKKIAKMDTLLFFRNLCSIFATFGFFVDFFKNASLGGYEYPPFSVGLGWLIILTGLLFIPVFAGIETMKRGKLVFEPAEDWGPYLEKHRGEKYKDMKEPTEKINFA